MKDMSRNTVIGILLIALGALALLSNVGVLSGLGSVLGAILFAAAGVLLVRLYARRDQIWSLPAAFSFFGLAAAALVDGPLSGPYFLGLTGAGFLLLYAVERRHWWTIIPGGALISLGVVAGVDELAPRMDAGPVLLFGLALTFLAVYAVGQRWAVWPALALGAIAVVALSTVSRWLLPVILIGAGLYLLYRRSNSGSSRPRAGASQAAEASRNPGVSERAAEPNAGAGELPAPEGEPR